MPAKLPDKLGYLLIDDETIAVLYCKDRYGARLKIRPLARSVLGEYLKDESGKIKSANPALLRKLRAGEVVSV